VRYKLEFTKKAQKKFDVLDPSVQRKIRRYLDENVDGSLDPRVVGKGLVENLSGFWRYRIGDYRVVCDIRDDTLLVLAVNVGHRSKIYS
jgi:mRNA interferase RelE/StbE